MKLDIHADTDVWTSLWAMEANSLKAFASGSRKAAVAPSDQPKPQQGKPYAVSGNVAIIPIVGGISKYPSVLDALCGGVSTLAIQAKIDAALYDDAVDSIVLFFDSPGGTVAGTSDLADYISTAKTLKPVTAYISDHCFSAAYWLASQCTRIIANEGAFIGSIGIYSVMMDSSKAADAVGIKVHLVSAGEYKGLEEDGLPLDAKAIEETQRLVNSAYDLFTKSVSKGRSLPSNSVIQLADGRSHIASEALSLNLIDAIGTLDAAIQFKDASMNDKTKAENPVADDSQPAPSDDVLKQILAQLGALTEQVSKLTQDEADEEPEEAPAEGEPAKADDDDENDVASKVAQAVAADRDRLKAISEACGSNRAEFVLNQFIAGSSAVEAKAALADQLINENTELRKAAKADGMEPLALGGPAPEAINTDDPEALWAKNIGDVQKAYSGKKEYFVAAFKHNKKRNI